MLSNEHIPPKSTGNSGRNQLEALGASEDGLRPRSVSDGVYLRVLCQNCNSNTGGSLGATFADFSKQVQRSGRLVSPRGRVFASALDIYPARIFRLLMLNFLCLHKEADDGRWSELRDFIQSRTLPPPARMPRVSLYYVQASTRHALPPQEMRRRETFKPGVSFGVRKVGRA